MITIKKDITTIESGTIVHQVNCRGAMGSGVALAIKKKWPEVYDAYRAYFDSEEFCLELNVLGAIDVVKINDSLSVVNLYGQDSYGNDGKRYTSYCAWELALPAIKNRNLPEPIYFPYNVGCDRGGGDWRIISAMIEEHFPDAIFCKWPPKK